MNVRKTLLSGLSVFAVLAVLGQDPAEASESRSYRAKRDFRLENPCPSTGKARGPCAGYVVDHVVPLCAGGPDEPANMQWQEVSEAKRKDADERKECRALKR